MQIIAWKCEATGSIFESKTKYQSHLKKLAKERAQKRKVEAFKKEREDFFTTMRDTCRNPDQIVEFIKANWDKFYQNAVANYRWNDSRTQFKNQPTLDWIKIDLHWSNTVSNSHNAPFGKKTNWGSRLKDEPTNYPGWIGNINYQVSEYISGLGSEMWEGTGINTGSGGYASNFYYGLELFAMDWPGMMDAREKAIIMKGLTGDSRKIEEIAEKDFA